MNARPLLFAPVALALATAAAAQAEVTEVASVLSSTAILEQVGTPRSVCTNEQVTVPGEKSGTGAIIGAIAGAAIGNQFGKGGGREVATVVGGVIGSQIGSKAEGSAQPQTRTVQNCREETVYSTGTRGYRVLYQYAGRRYEVEMPYDPGSTLRVKVVPVIN
jgi:uncharacterized protein YcfJ